MGLLIWLEIYFRLRHWDIYPDHLQAFLGLFESAQMPQMPQMPQNSIKNGGAQMPQNSIKSNFLVGSDHLSYKNGSIDLARGPPSSLDIGTYIPPTCGPLSTPLGPIGRAQMPQTSINTHPWAVLDHFSYMYRPIDLVRCPFPNLDTGKYIRPTCGSVCTFWVHWGGVLKCHEAG
jgi:hypothetical protein